MRDDPRYTKIIKTALLGTQNRVLEQDIFPSTIQDKLSQNQTSEEIFLDGLSMSLSYWDGGDEPTYIPNISQKITICPDEEYPYVSSDIELLLELMDIDSMEVYIPIILSHLKDTHQIFNPSHLVRIVSLSPKHLRPKVIEAFGHRAKWIYQYSSPDKPIEYIELKRDKRKSVYKNLIDSDIDEVIVFLQEIFEAETMPNRMIYLKLLNNTHKENNLKIIQWIKDTLSQNISTSKSYEKLQSYIYLLEINNLHTSQYQLLKDDIASQIWDKRGRLNKDLDTLFADFIHLDISSYYNLPKDMGIIDSCMFLVLASIDALDFCDIYGISLKTFINRVSKIELIDSTPKSTNSLEIFSFVEALVPNIVKYEQKELGLALYKSFGFHLVGKAILRLLDPIELVSFLRKNREILYNEGISLLSLMADELKSDFMWTEEFTKFIFIETFRGYYADNRLKSILWRVSPYLHSDFLNIYEKLSNHQKYYASENLQETIRDIGLFKKAFDKSGVDA